MELCGRTDRTFLVLVTSLGAGYCLWLVQISVVGRMSSHGKQCIALGHHLRREHFALKQLHLQPVALNMFVVVFVFPSPVAVTQDQVIPLQELPMKETGNSMAFLYHLSLQMVPPNPF